MEIEGKLLLYYTLEAFQKSVVDEVIVVVGAVEESYCKEDIIKRYNIDKVRAVVVGGKERYDSVYNGLKAIQMAEYVLVHDGARPCITSELIDKLMENVKQNQASVLGVSVKDKLKIVDSKERITSTPDRYVARKNSV